MHREYYGSVIGGKELPAARTDTLEVVTLMAEEVLPRLVLPS